MRILKVTDMHCEHCVARIEKALKAAGLTFQVSLADRTVSIDGCDNSVKTAIAELDDLGLDAKEI